MTLFEFPLPDIGEGVAEGEITAWNVAVGDVIEEDQDLCEVMTDKATVPITSPLPGKVVEIRVQEGEVAPVGATLLVIEPAEGAHIPTVAKHGDHDDEPAAEETPATEAPTQEMPAAAPAGALAELEIERPEGRRALATPYTRKLARTLGVDIERIKGTGEVGRVTPDDVEHYAAAASGAAPTEAPTTPVAVAAAPAPVPLPAVPPPAPLPPGERETRVPIRGLRKVISERMLASKSQAAHFTYVDECDVTELVRIRRDMKEEAAQQGAKLTYLPFIMKAISSALRAFPTLNGLSDLANNEFVVRHDHNFGVAVDTPNGLVVPVVKGVDRRSLLDLAREITRVAGDARDGRSKLEDLQDGTFTITNAGNIGGLFATPVINYPEAAIVGVHAINKKPWVVDGEIAIRDIMYLSISVDHRMNDGALAAHFMNHVIGLLRAPHKLFLQL